jgi:hypothetical protein
VAILKFQMAVIEILTFESSICQSIFHILDLSVSEFDCGNCL